MIVYEEEISSVEDIYEDDVIVLMKATFKSNFLDIERISAGVKNESGDIEKIVTITERYL